MRTTRIVSGFVGWRWTPFCALVAGSLVYVGLVVLVVPDSLGKPPKSQLSAPLAPQSDTLTTRTLGSSPSLSQHRTLAGAGLAREPDAPVAPQRHIVESRAAALGGEPRLIRAPSPPPAPAPPPPPAPPPEPVEQTPPPNEPPARQAREPEPPIIQHRVLNGLHLIAPHIAAPPGNADKPADDGDNGGSDKSGDKAQE